MAKYDQGGGCPCGLYKECECKIEVNKPADKYMEKLEKIERDLLELRKMISVIIPQTYSNKCSICNQTFNGVTNYYCSNINCPMFSKTSSSVI